MEQNQQGRGGGGVGVWRREAALPWLNLQFLMNLKGRLALTQNRASCIFKCFATKRLTPKTEVDTERLKTMETNETVLRANGVFTVQLLTFIFTACPASEAQGLEGSDSVVAASLTCWITLSKSLFHICAI